MAKLFVSKWYDLGIPSTVRVIYLSKEVFADIDRCNFDSVFVDNKLTEYRENVKKEINNDRDPTSVTE